MTISASLIAIFNSQLEQLKAEISLYQREENLWHTAGGIPNTAGNLTLHLVGNLNNYIGNDLGNTGYVRNRELEFSLRDIPRSVLLQMVEDTRQMINVVLEKLETAQYEKDFPAIIWEKPMNTHYTLVRLSSHLAYHLGQINYHRRMLDR
ncbi:MAG: DUF1572 family protein [Bacteroidetes bacterium]|nr:DUF1572 family protein [Bacteroidota bacterium]